MWSQTPFIKSDICSFFVSHLLHFYSSETLSKCGATLTACVDSDDILRSFYIFFLYFAHNRAQICEIKLM